MLFLSMIRILSWLTAILVGLAVFCSIGLLASDTKIGWPQGFSSTSISAASLLLIGVSFLIAQGIMRPRYSDLLKNLLLAAAFILWGTVQLMEPNSLSKKLGNVVIALYVVDLAWVILSSVNLTGTIRSSSLKSDSPEG
jgi:hypothetical protein